MSPDTPLAEVAHLLGQGTAKYLLRQAPEIQHACLAAVRVFVMEIEKVETLDPITIQDRIDHYVRGFVMSLKGEKYA